MNKTIEIVGGHVLLDVLVVHADGLQKVRELLGLEKRSVRNAELIRGPQLMLSQSQRPGEMRSLLIMLYLMMMMHLVRMTSWLLSFRIVLQNGCRLMPVRPKIPMIP